MEFRFLHLYPDLMSLYGSYANVSVLVRQLELLPETTVIERLTGDGDKRTLLAPLWSRDKISVLGGIDRAMARADTWQGRLFDTV